MAIDPSVARALEEVDQLRAERARIERDLAEKVERAMELTGLGGMWARVRGSYEAQVAEAEREITELKAVLQIAVQAVEQSEARLATARSGAPRAAVVERESVEPAEPVASVARAGSGDTLLERLAAIEELEAVLKPMRSAGQRLVARAQTAARRNGLSASRRSGANLLGNLVDHARAFHHDQVLDEVKGEWDGHAAQAGAVAARHGLPSSLSQVGGARASRELGALDSRAHGFPVSATFTGLDAFADAVEQLLPELDALLEHLRETHRELRRGQPAPQAQSPSGVDGPDERGWGIAELVRRWERLLELGRQLDRACVPGVRTSQLLGPMTAWNREAADAAELADALGLPLRPPINEGGDLVGFITELRTSLPAFEQRVRALSRL